MSTALESNSRVDDMTDFEILMHEDHNCEILTECPNNAEWLGRFCRPCKVSASVCGTHKNFLQRDINRGAHIVCEYCHSTLHPSTITWTKI